jgi:Tfp pilus assembly protein PilO
MLKNFKLPTGNPAAWKNTQGLLRISVVLLLAANLITAAFAFHWFGNPALDTEEQVRSTQRQLAQAQARLMQSRTMAGKVEQARAAGDQFLSTYMTDRRDTYSTVLAEMNRIAGEAHLKSKEKALPPLQPIEGSDNLSVMTLTANYEGTYADLLRFLNLLDKSRRFIIIESLQASPVQGGNTLNISIQVNTFVRGDAEGSV